MVEQSYPHGTDFEKTEYFASVQQPRDAHSGEMEVTLCTENEIRDLVDRARRGDSEAFGALTATLRERLLAFTTTRLGPELRRRFEPDDVLQDALLRAFESIERFEWRGGDSAFSWIASIVEFRIRDLARPARRRPQVALGPEPPDDEASPSDRLHRFERRERLEDALGRLSPAHERVIRWARIERLTTAQIAERLDRSEGAVRHLLLRALEKLRESYGEATGSLRLADPIGDDAEEVDGDK